MRALAVLAERLPVVRRDDDERAVERARAAQAIQKGTERRVRVGDFPRVRIGGVARSIRLRRLVGIVRIVEVDPGEPRHPRIADCWLPIDCRLLIEDPVGSGREHLLGRALEHRQFAARGARSVVVVVYVEAGVEAEARVDRKRADEGAGSIARGFQRAGDRRAPAVEPERAVVAHAARERISAGHDRGM